VVAAEPGNAQARLRLALAYFGSAQLNRAHAELVELVERDPADPSTRYLLGRTLERLSRHAQALLHLRLAAAMSGDLEYVVAVQRVQTRPAG
jgi:predicted Zn-dependent protease